MVIGNVISLKKGFLAGDDKFKPSHPSDRKAYAFMTTSVRSRRVYEVYLTIVNNLFNIFNSIDKGLLFKRI